jgi:hypothetical protein
MHRTYNPLKGPDRAGWLAQSEEERTRLVTEYRQRKRIELPNLQMHVMVHVIVENQIALGEETPAERTLQRLLRQGLDRHEAVHAIGSVLMAHLRGISSAAEPDADNNDIYFAELEQLTAASWRRDNGPRRSDD